MDMKKNEDVFYTKKAVKDQLPEMIDSYLESRPKVLNG